ncbi:glucose 1-dehydrogenase [Crossiella cryophila]|uniref:3alpha(Or 20beta)-hydroxysteroid dehydrogenase n=1 Tax=Crossiella cryophila TaxID=43355 RepID=A0A7W7CCT7_9PSEU|nr:glucose 1-dehydrogenase [Crossiella cryophila]MBB4677523.1 3alpha(or 20beta)-hydroxysteroid dehydrogenase [Crossiella cryophila]
MRLDGKVALVTGAARGLGEAVVRRFLREGARVVLADIADDTGHRLAAEFGPNARYRHLDVGSEDDWAGVVAETVTDLGRLDVLVNNAAVLHFAPLAQTTLADYERVIRVNQVGCFLGMRAVIPVMTEARAGSIVNVSSVEGLAGMPTLSAYTASKFAIRGMTKVAALELAAQGVRVNSVHPGAMDTQMASEALGGIEIDRTAMGKLVPMKRIGQPEEVANVVLFLASDESSYCSGGEFAADGGATATHAFGSVG